jgi:predicted alpha/beta superfamily hydrolase
VAARRSMIQHALMAVVPGLALAACAGAGARVPGGPQTAFSRVDTFGVVMPQLGGRDRTVRVYLPPGYDGGEARYPVLYLQDGQNLFSAGAYGDWRVDETLDSLVAAGRTPGIIVVGIDSGARRWDEYGPWSNPRMQDWVDSTWARGHEGGDGDAYVEFVAATLKPQVDRRYRTLPGREHTGIGGSSMGGLVALYAGLARPDVFSKVMSMSTAVWFAERGGPWLSSNRLLAEIRGRRLPSDVRFYLDVGTEERSREREPDVADAAGRPVTYPRAYVEGSEAAYAALRDGGVPAENLRHVVDAGAVHHERAWAKRFPEALLWLYR